MRVLFLNHNVAWRGGFFRAYHWGRHLAIKGHDVTLLTISESARWRFEIQDREGLKLIKSPDLLVGKLRTGWDPWDTARRLCHLLPNRYDLVHSVDSRPACIFPGLALKKLRGAKLVVDWGDWWGRGGTIRERSSGLAEQLFAPVETFFEEGFRQFADGTVVLSSALEKRAVELGVQASTIVRIPHGADVIGINILDKENARKELGIHADIPVVGYVGLLFSRDAELLISAYQQAHAADSRMKLLLIGNCNASAPRKLIDSGAVVVTGPVSYELLQKYIAACDLMLLPLKDSIANNGRWPSKIGDYLAAGKPVVATRVGDVAALIEQGECGVLTDDTAAGFAAGIVETLHNRAQLVEMSGRARRVAEDKLDWRVLTDQLEEFYLRVLSQCN